MDVANNRERLEALFQVESKSLGDIEKTYEQLASTYQKCRQMQSLAEKLLHENRTQLWRSQVRNLQQTYITLVKSAGTTEERKRLIDHYENRVAELRELLPEEE